MAFAYCKGLTGDLIIPDSVQTMGYNVFIGCFGIYGNIFIPDGVVISDPPSGLLIMF
jgi:hypothetical protein